MDAAAGELSRILGPMLRERMDARGISQNRLAREIGITQPQLSRLLSGNRNWQLELFADACRYLGTRASDMLAVAEDALAER